MSFLHPAKMNGWNWNSKNGGLVQMIFLFKIQFGDFFRVFAKGHLPRCKSKVKKKIIQNVEASTGFPEVFSNVFWCVFFVFRVSLWVRANARREQVEMLEGFKVDLKGPSLPPLEDWAFSGRELTGVLWFVHGEFLFLVWVSYPTPKKKVRVCLLRGEGGGDIFHWKN